MKNIALEIRSLVNLIGRQMHKDVVDHNISMPQGRIIKYLIDHKDQQISQKDFEKILMIRKSTISRMISLMEANGLIIKEPDLLDSRKNYIKVTDKSLVFHQMVEDKFDLIETKMIENISANDLDIFLSVISKMQNNLKNEEDNKI